MSGANRRISENETGFVLPLVVARECEHAPIGTMAGIEIVDGEHNGFAGFGIGTGFADRTVLLAEIGGPGGHTRETKHALRNVGASPSHAVRC